MQAEGISSSKPKEYKGLERDKRSSKLIRSISKEGLTKGAIENVKNLIYAPEPQKFSTPRKFSSSSEKSSSQDSLPKINPVVKISKSVTFEVFETNVNSVELLHESLSDSDEISSLAQQTISNLNLPYPQLPHSRPLIIAESPSAIESKKLEYLKKPEYLLEEMLNLSTAERMKSAGRRQRIKGELIRLKRSLAVKDSYEFHSESYNVHNQHPNVLILSAISEGITHFLDDKGAEYFLWDIFELVDKISEDQFPGRADHIRDKLSSYYFKREQKKIHQILKPEVFSSSNLPFLSQLTQEESNCLNLLINIAPLRKQERLNRSFVSKNFSFLSFILIYHDYISTEQLFKLINLLLNCHLIHKIKLRLLTLCGTWHESNIFDEEKGQSAIKDSFNVIVKTCHQLYETKKSPENLEILKLCDEIELIFNHSAPKNPIGSEFFHSNECINFEKFLHSFLFKDHVSEREMLPIFDKIANDLMISAQSMILTINPLHSLNAELLKTYPLVSDFSNDISRFIKYCYIDQIKNENTKRKEVLENENLQRMIKSSKLSHVDIHKQSAIKNSDIDDHKSKYGLTANDLTYIQDKELENIKIKCFKFYIALINILVNKKDYFTSSIVFSKINKMFTKIICAAQENTKKIDESTMVKYNQFNMLFSPIGSFKNLRNEIELCRLFRKPYIPNLQAMFSKNAHDMKLIHQNESINDDGISVTSEVEKKYNYDQALLVESIYDLIQDGVKYQVRKNLPSIFHTNILYLISQYKNRMQAQK